MKRVLISLLAMLLLLTTGAAAVSAEEGGKPKDPECVGEECEVEPYYIPCEHGEPDCSGLD